MKDAKHHTKISKFLSLVLRHSPETIGIQLDDQGWTSVEDLLAKMNQKGKSVDMDTLEEVVATNNKKRFAFNEDHTMIRANQGHSVEISLGYTAIEPPEILYHGTGNQNVSNIFKTGLNKMSRHHVHLSADVETAVKVGQRHGKPVVLEVRALEMTKAGHLFYRSENGVWLTDEVPPLFLNKS